MVKQNIQLCSHISNSQIEDISLRRFSCSSPSNQKSISFSVLGVEERKDAKVFLL